MAEKLGNITAFKSEKIKLSLIAMTFVISYSIDILYEFTFWNNNSQKQYLSIIV